MSTWANKINYFPKWTYQFWFLFGVSDVRYQSGSGSLTGTLEQ